MLLPGMVARHRSLWQGFAWWGSAQRQLLRTPMRPPHMPIWSFLSSCVLIETRRDSCRVNGIIRHKVPVPIHAFKKSPGTLTLAEEGTLNEGERLFVHG